MISVNIISLMAVYLHIVISLLAESCKSTN